MFHTAAAVRRRLDEAGFAYLPESKPWEVRRGGHYYTVRNNSSIIAFKVGAKLDAYRFQLTASHSDSPTYKVKAAPELSGPSSYMRLNVEAYGGVMDHTWFDRALVRCRAACWCVRRPRGKPPDRARCGSADHPSRAHPS